MTYYIDSWAWNIECSLRLYPFRVQFRAIGELIFSFKGALIFKCRCSWADLVLNIIVYSLNFQPNLIFLPFWRPNWWVHFERALWRIREILSESLNPIHHERADHQLKISYCWTQALSTAKISPQKKIIQKNSCFRQDSNLRPVK